jgi:uncharacterized protein involved in outer membrane biogenesis
MASTKPASGTTLWRLARQLLLGLFGLIGFALLLLLMLPYIVSLDRVKGQIVAQVEAALQRKIDVGAVRLQLLSGLGAGLEDLIIDNPPGWQQPYFIKAGRLSVKVAWRPLLLQRQLAITQMIVSDGDIIIERDAQGRMNVADLAPSTPEPANTLATQGRRSASPAGAQSAANPLPRLFVADVTLQKMQITFVDRMVVPGQEIITAVRHFQLNVHNVGLEAPISIDLTATILTDGSRNLHLRGSVGPIAESLAAESVPINVHLRTSDVFLDKLRPYLGANFPLIQGRLGGDVAVQGSIASGLRINGTLALVDAGLHERLMPYASNALPKLTSTQEMTIDLPNGQAALTDVQINVSSFQASIKGVVHQFATTPQFDIQLETKTFTPGELLTQFPMLDSLVPTPIDLRGNVQLQATFTGTPHDLRSEARIDVDELALRSGSFNGGAQEGGGMIFETGKVNARLVTQLTSSDLPHVHIDVRLQRLMFDQRGAHGAAPKTDPQPGPDTQTTRATPKPPPVSLSGNVSVAEGRVQNLNFQRLAAEFNLIQGLLKTSQQMSLYGGSYQGAVQIDLTQPEPSYTLDATFADLDARRVINELTPAKDVLLGVLDTDMRLSGRGFTWDVINKTLSGDGHIRIAEAQLTTFDLIPTLLQVLRQVGRLAGLAIPSTWEDNAFRAIEGDWHLRHGKFLSDHLRLRGEGTEALLRGYIGLDQTLDYTGTFMLPAKFIALRDAPTLLRRDDAGRVILPFTVRGTVTAPRIAFDGKALADVAQEELVDQVRERLGDTIEGLLGKPSPGDRPPQEADKPGRETGDEPTRQDLPGRILRELFRR